MVSRRPVGGASLGNKTFRAQHLLRIKVSRNTSVEEESILGDDSLGEYRSLGKHQFCGNMFLGYAISGDTHCGGSQVESQFWRMKMLGR